MANRGPSRPAGLGPAGGRLWKATVAAYLLRVDELVVLEAACRTVDTLARLEAALVDAPLTVPGSMGQLREHPLLAEARQQRMAAGRLLRQLDLPDDVGELAEARAAARSSQGRSLAAARWRRDGTGSASAL